MMAPVIPPEAVALFTKAPVPGNVKTRLQPPLSPVEAADLHLAFATDTWSKMEHLAPAATYLYSDNGSATYRDWAGAQARLQRGEHLGERMAACFLELQQAGYQSILIVGSDIPSLPLEYLQLGLTMLQDCDAVLGPVVQRRLSRLLVEVEDINLTLVHHLQRAHPDAMRSAVRQLGRIDRRNAVVGRRRMLGGGRRAYQQSRRG
jgi:glycosyltransferase A (GT-A) superfamily protein (DUF2064 family)